MTENTTVDDTLRRLRADRRTSDSLLADWEAIANGEAGLNQAELHAKQQRDKLDRHRRNRPRVPIKISTTPDGGVFVGGVDGPNRQEAVLLRGDLYQAGAQCDWYEGGDSDQYEVLSFASHPKTEWAERLQQVLLRVGYVNVHRIAIVWPAEPVQGP